MLNISRYMYLSLKLYAALPFWPGPSKRKLLLRTVAKGRYLPAPHPIIMFQPVRRVHVKTLEHRYRINLHSLPDVGCDLLLVEEAKAGYLRPRRAH